MRKKILNFCFFTVIVMIPFKIFATEYVTCSLRGQLGNHLLTVSTALALAWDHNATPVFPDINRTDLNLPIEKEKIFFRLDSTRPANIQFSPQYLPFEYSPIKYRPNLRIEGYSPNALYFDHHREKLIKLFAPSEKMMETLQTKYADILSHTNSVAVHVRTFHPRIHNFTFPFLGAEYFKKAMDQFSEDSLFVIFSDRIGWSKKYLGGYKKNMVFIQGNDHVTDFFLMSLCKNIITANSSFSWWAAYLNSNPNKKVVVPKYWYQKNSSWSTKGFPTKYKGVYPQEWIVMDFDFPPPQQDLLSFPSTSFHERQ